MWQHISLHNGFLVITLLVASHGIAVIDLCAWIAVFIELQGIGVAELCTAICQYIRHEQSKLDMISQSVLYLINSHPDCPWCTALQKPAHKKLRWGKVDCEDTLQGAPGGKDCVHLNKIVRIKIQSLEVIVGTSFKNSPVDDLLFMALSGFELCLPFQIDIPRQEDTLVDIVVERLNTHIELRKVCQDHVGGLPLIHQRADDSVNKDQILPGKVDTFPGGRPLFLIEPLRDSRIVIVFCLDRTQVPGLFAPITNIGSGIDPGTVFPFKAGTDAVALMAGTAFCIAYDQLVTGIRLLAVVTMNAEVIRVIETPPVPGVDPPVTQDLFGNGGWIFAEITSYIGKCHALIQSLFNIQSVINRQMFIVSRYQFGHSNLLSTATGKQ